MRNKPAPPQTVTVRAQESGDAMNLTQWQSGTVGLSLCFSPNPRPLPFLLLDTTLAEVLDLCKFAQGMLIK